MLLVMMSVLAAAAMRVITTTRSHAMLFIFHVEASEILTETRTAEEQWPRVVLVLVLDRDRELAK